MVMSVNPEQFNLFDDTSEEIVSSDGYSNIPRTRGEVSVDVAERAKHLKKAASLLGPVVQRSALPKAMEVAPIRRRLEKQYNSVDEPNALEEEVLPGAQINRSQLAQEADKEFDAAFGDFELAKKAAWEHFSPEERIALELDDKYDQEVIRTSFRGKMTNTERSTHKQNGQPRSRKSRVTVGAVNRHKLKTQMDRTLQQQQRPDKKAA